VTLTYVDIAQNRGPAAISEKRRKNGIFKGAWVPDSQPGVPQPSFYAITLQVFPKWHPPCESPWPETTDGEMIDDAVWSIIAMLHNSISSILLDLVIQFFWYLKLGRDNCYLK
jgi:hypothetical protein